MDTVKSLLSAGVIIAGFLSGVFWVKAAYARPSQVRVKALDTADHQ
jgi:hypothetical protein